MTAITTPLDNKDLKSGDLIIGDDNAYLILQCSTSIHSKFRVDYVIFSINDEPFVSKDQDFIGPFMIKGDVLIRNE